MEIDSILGYLQKFLNNGKATETESCLKVATGQKCIEGKSICPLTFWL